MLSKKSLFASALLLGSTSATFAGTMGPASNHTIPFYLGFDGGASISTEAHFRPQVIEGAINFRPVGNATFDRDIGSTGVVGAFVGYNWNENLAVQFGYAYRNHYNWAIDGNDSAGYPDDPYELYQAKGITIQTYLFDLLLKPSGSWGGFIPYIKGGIGVATNRIGALQDVDIPVSGNPVSFNSIIRGHTSTNFAWDAGVGADYFVTNQVSIGFGYRFVGTGELKTGNSSIDLISGTVVPVTSPFKAQNIYLNEVVASIAYHFDRV